jgi:hypothetical protein
MNIYVSSLQAGVGNGTEASPFKTVSEAKAKIREIIKNGISEPITVYIGEGNYSVNSLRFTKEDSGSADFPISYVATGRAVLNSGINIPYTAFEKVSEEIYEILSPEAKDRVLCADLGKFGITRADYGELCAIGSHNSAFLYDGAVTSPMWCELFVNDKRQTIARYPNDSFLKLKDPISEGEGWDSATHKGIPHDTWVKMRNPKADVYGIDTDTAKRAAAWKKADEVWMFGYPRHDWADMSTPIISFDADKCSMTSRYVSMFGIMLESKRDDYHNGGNYYLYNVLDELDAPGEWYLDRKERMLYLYPSCDLSQAQILLSLATSPTLQFDDAEYISFRGFEIVGTRAEGIGGKCSNISIEDCLIKNVAGHGIHLIGRENRVIGCEITETGRGGIYLDGGDRPTLTHGDNVAENNYVHDFSRIYQTYQSGIHLLGCGNTAKHNEICNTPHQAIGYYGNEHLIEYNYIHDTTYLSSDAGAIYSGFDWTAHGTVIRYNLIERIGGNGYRSDGIYWDDGLSGQTAYGNVLVDVEKFSLQLGGGHDNKFFGNLIIRSGSAALKFDQRYRDAYFTKSNSYPAIAHDGSSRSHFTKLELMPYRSDTWAAKYPHLALIKTSPDTDPDDKDYPINPSYCEVVRNAIVEPRGNAERIFPDVRRYSTVESNPVYKTCEEAGVDATSYRMKIDSVIFRDIQDFSPIPFDKIGRYE